MYTKIELNGMKKEVDVSELDFYCKCPKCGEEVAVPEFWELVQEESFDPFNSAVWCDDCHDLLHATRDIIQEQDGVSCLIGRALSLCFGRRW